MAPTGGKIQNLFQALDSQDSTNNILEVLYRKTFQVLQLSRYYPDPRSRSYFGFERTQFWDLFDITLGLADGKNRRKFVTSADIVRKLKVFTGSQVQLKHVERFRGTSGDGEAGAIVVIRDMEVVGDEPFQISGKLLHLPMVPRASSQDEEEKPLVSNRHYYMDNWTFNLAKGQVFPEVRHVAFGDIDLCTVRSIKDVVQRSLTCEKGCMLVKVMRKSRLIHYVNQYKDDKWPFQLPLVVADSTGWCCAVAWNSLAVQLYSHIHEGSVLLLKNTRMKPHSVQRDSKSFFSPPADASVFSNELSMDIRNPKTEVAVVDFDNDEEPVSLNLPHLELRLMSRVDLISVPDLSVVDVEGLVIYVSWVEREQRKTRLQNPIDSGGFFYRRWVHLRDNSVEDPILLQIYSGDQLSTFHALQPGQYILCRHMLSNQQLEDLTSSRQRRYQWLVTTANSRIYVVDGPGKEFVPYELKGELHVTDIGNARTYSHLFKEGGMFRYPPYTKGLDFLLGLDSMERLQVYEHRLTTWRECRRLVVTACLKSVQYVDLTYKLKTKSLRPRRKKARTKDTEDTPEDGSGPDDHTVRELLNLWPVSQKSKLTAPRGVLQCDWEETQTAHHFTTWKPCALSLDADQDKVDNLETFLSGRHDCDLGLVRARKSSLSKTEVSSLADSASSSSDVEFVLLLDAWTTQRNNKIFILDRAYPVTRSVGPH